ncbi:MAG: SPFH domain-containing protein [Acidobacteriota bacterium]|nr:SPFH domain-containing protein [Acidobacteriota bacterium]
MERQIVEHRENRLSVGSGIGMLCLLVLLILLAIGGVAVFGIWQVIPVVIFCAVCIPVLIFLMFGLFMVHPNEAKVLQLFGSYRGSVYDTGLRWANPFLSKPIEIGAVVVWRVTDSAEALFNVDDYEDYVQVQSEAALRNMATGYPYDAHEEGEISLSHHTAEISERLRGEVQERLATAGVEVIEARISHLAYAAEIAAAMLQRQQAAAVVAARAQIVDGAVGMVEQALNMLSEKDVVHLDDERKAAMVSNLLAVLCSDRHTQPVVNTGTLYP